MPVPLIVGTALVGGIIRYALSILGVGIVSYIGADALVSAAFTQIKSSLSSAGAAAQFAGLMGVDQAISAVLSGVSIRISLSALKSFKIL